MKKLTKEEMTELVRKLFQGLGGEDEASECLDLLKTNTGCPYVAELIFWPKTSLTPEEVIEKALEYKPLITPPPNE